MTITLRGNKTSALDTAEFDANFTTLGLTHGMTTSNVAITTNTATASTGNFTTINSTTINTTTINGSDLDVSKIIINATETGTDARLQANTGQYDGVRFMRTGQITANARSSCLIVTEFTDQGHTAGQGTGYWTRIKTTDKESHGGAVMTMFESVTDSDNWTAKLELRPVKSTAGSEDYSTSVMTVSQDKVEIKNTSAVYIQNLPTSDPLSAGQLWNNSGVLSVSAG